jgi:hypothetical protein
MFGNQRSQQVKVQIKSLESERDRLNDSNRKIRDELADLKQQKRMEDENIRHLVKIKEEKLDIEHEKKQVERERVQQEVIAKVKDEYRNKQESTLQKQIDDGKEMSAEILARLPNVSVRLKGDV